MDGRFSTSKPKSEKVAGQKQRYSDHRRRRRRTKFLLDVATTVQPELFLPEESIDLLWGPLNAAKRIVKAAERRQLLTKSQTKFISANSQPDENLSTAARSTRVLSRLNRSTVFPPLVAKEVTIEALSVNEILATLSLERGKTPPHQLLDAFAVASGMSWETCAEILLARRIIPCCIDGDDITAIQRARRFWNQYAEGRATYLTICAKEDVPRFRGDWAFFGREKLEMLLPGINIPDKLKRDEYLTNSVPVADHFSLDVHAMPTAAPLFQHRFLEKFNPLFFGKRLDRKPVTK
jgi:hypothetical protein